MSEAGVFVSEVRQWFIRLVGSLHLAARYVCTGFARAKSGLFIGIGTIALVVGFIAVLQGTVSQSPLIFLRLAENSVGEADLVMYSEVSATHSSPFMNFTDVSSLLANTSGIQGVVPRWIFLAQLSSPTDRTRNTSVVLLALDSALEATAQLGSSWNLPPLGQSDAYVSQSALDEIGVTAGTGDSATIQLSLSNALNLLSTSTSSGKFNIPSTLTAATVSTALGSLGIHLSTVTINPSPALRAFLNLIGLNSSFLNSTSFDVTVDPYALLAAALTTTLSLNSGGNGQLSVSKSVTVNAGVGSPEGKWPSSFGNVVVLEAKNIPLWATSIVTNALDVVDSTASALGVGSQVKNITNEIRNQTNRVNYNLMKQYAMQTIVQFEDRQSMYVQSGDSLTHSIIEHSNRVGDALGVTYPVTISAPLATALVQSSFIRLFLDQIFGAVVFLLVLMGVLAIYSLVLGDVEAKTYEYGMLRVLGLQHSTLAHLLSIQSVTFSLPGVTACRYPLLSIASLLYLIASGIISGVASVTINKTMPGSAWIIGIVIGAGMPILANIIPIRRALSSQLRDAIDLYHQTFSDVKVTVVYLAKLGLSTWQLSLATLMVLVGLTTYYLVPLAFVTKNFALFLGILNAVLLGMLLGLSMVAQALQGGVELLLVWLFVWGKDRTLKTVITKNLSGHRSRNRKTAYMVSIAVAFLIFAGAMFALQATSIQSTVRLLLGADINVLSLSGFTHVLPQEDLLSYLSTVTVGSPNLPTGVTPIVAGYSFLTFPLSYLDGVRRTPLTNLVNITRPHTELYGLQANYLDVTYDGYTVITEAQSTADEKNIVGALHAGEGNIVLPVQSLIAQPPPSINTADMSWQSYVCNASSPEEAVDVLISRPNSTFYFFEQCASACSGINNSFAVDGCVGVSVSPNTSVQSADIARTYLNDIDVIFSTALGDLVSVNVHQPLLLETLLRVSGINDALPYLSKARAMISKLPGFFFSSYLPSAYTAPAIVTMQSYGRMLLDARRGIANIQAGIAGVSGGDITDSSDGSSTGSTGGSSTSGSSPTPSSGPIAPPQWIPSQISWAANNNSNYSSPVINDVTAALDNDAATVVTFPLPAPPAWIAVDLGSCTGVGGIRFRLPGLPSDVTRWEVLAGPQIEGPFYSVATGACVELSSSALGAWIPFAFPPFSARYWRVVLHDSLSLSSVTVSDIQFATQTADVCDADLLSLDDLSIGVPKQRLIVKLVPGFTDEDRIRVVRGLQSVITDNLITVQDTAAFLSSTKSAVDGLNAFFTFVAILCAVLIFFAAWLSFDANVRENSREFGILRALGLSVAQVTRVFLYEAVAVVLAAFLLGTSIGLLIAISLTLQFNLFLEMPFEFTFPTMIFCVVLSSILLVSVVSSLLPVLRLANISIANVVKGRT